MLYSEGYDSTAAPTSSLMSPATGSEERQYANYWLRRMLNELERNSSRL